MFSMKLDNTITAVFSFLIKLLQEQMELAKIVVTNDAVILTAMNDSMTGLTRIIVGRPSCLEFAYTSDLTVGISLKALAAVLSSSGPTEHVIFTLDMDVLRVETNPCTVFEINLLDLDTEDLTIPDVEPCAVVTTADMTALMKKVSKLEAHKMTLSMVDGAVNVTAVGDLVKRAAFQLPSERTKQQDLRVTVSPKNLAWLGKFGKIQKKFGMSMGENRPLGVHAAVDHLRVDAFLAPMMEDP